MTSIPRIPLAAEYRPLTGWSRFLIPVRLPAGTSWYKKSEQRVLSTEILREAPSEGGEVGNPGRRKAPGFLLVRCPRGSGRVPNVCKRLVADEEAEAAGASGHRFAGGWEEHPKPSPASVSVPPVQKFCTYGGNALTSLYRAVLLTSYFPEPRETLLRHTYCTWRKSDS